MSHHSESQYKHRFGGLKNVTGDEWVYINAQCEHREALGKKTDIYLGDQRLSSKRVTLARSRVRKNDSIYRISKPAANSE